MSIYKVAVLPGNGIGPSVMKGALKILNSTVQKRGLKLEVKEAEIGRAGIDAYGVTLSDETLKFCEQSDAILPGSAGGPKWDNLLIGQRPERVSLLPLRRHFNLFVNLRSCRIYGGLRHASPLKDEIIQKSMDISCIKELTGGIYLGRQELDKESVYDTETYAKVEIEGITRLVLKSARIRNKRVHLVDKANVLASSTLWRDVVDQIAKEYKDIKSEYMYVDNAAMQIIKNPNTFDVMLCSNLFGDILSDKSVAISGSLGLLCSASLNDKGSGLCEPAGDSTPDIAHLDTANPIVQILSAALMLKYSLKKEKIARDIENIIAIVLERGKMTKDLNASSYLSTNEVGDCVVEILKENNNG